VAVSKRRLLVGALGGALGSIAMKAVVRFWDPNAFGLSSRTDGTAARALFGQDLDQKRAEKIGAALHYGFGIATGAGYAAAAARHPVIRAGRGTAFGGGLWLVGDELAVSLGRLENASAAKASSHGSALAAHIVYGVTVDLCCSKVG
jgi:uncharacterized membrane protein YagU involved in acid resistance